jgi:hypothetical protein
VKQVLALAPKLELIVNRKSTVMKKIMQYIILGTLLWMFAVMQSLQAQVGRDMLVDLSEQEEEAINALVLYPEETRLAILDASLHPEALVKLEAIQTQSRNAFQDILAGYPQSTQEVIWDLTRYPGLVERLVALQGASNREVNETLDAYPEIIHERAKLALQSYSWEMRSIHQLSLDAEVAFSNLLASYGPETRAALQHLIDLPEVLSMLTDNIRLTLLVGDLYKKDPAWVLHKADSLNLVVAQQQAQELQDWKTSLENDPEAMRELQESAEAFGDEHGYYYEDYYEEPFDDVYYQEEPTREVHNYHYYHYPYWFGYPYWYSYPRWRMYPYWYDWGFYFRPGRTVVVLNLPSFYFTNWYFYHPYHHYRWSHLSAHFTKHYYGHRRYGSSITAGVTVWKNQNRAVVSDEFLRNDGRLNERFREFGKFEADRARYNRNHPQKQMDQIEFREKNSDRYRDLSRTSTDRRTIQPGEERTRIPTDVTRQPQPEPRRKVTIPPKQTEPREKVTTPRTRIPTVKKGAEQHRSILERSRATRTRTVKPATPKTKAPPKVSKPRTRTVKKKNN